MIPHSIRTVLARMTLVLLVTGCVTDQSLEREPEIAYMPTDQTGKSSEQLRTELESGLKQATYFQRWKPISIRNEGVRQMEVGEDYVFIKFDLAFRPETEPKKDEYSIYSFAFERLSERPYNSTTCGPKRSPLPDEGYVRLSAPIGYQLCDVLYTLGLRAQQQRDAEQAHFAQLATQVRGRAPATVPESLRRLIIQAEALRQDKNYPAAAGAFRKVIRQDPVAYPAAHLNLALLYEMQGDHSRAIESMQRYLLLQPHANDARAAQDKIYEWEMKAGRK